MKNLIIPQFYICRTPLLTNTRMFPYLATLCVMDIFPLSVQYQPGAKNPSTKFPLLKLQMLYISLMAISLPVFCLQHRSKVKIHRISSSSSLFISLFLHTGLNFPLSETSVQETQTKKPGSLPGLSFIPLGTSSSCPKLSPFADPGIHFLSHHTAGTSASTTASVS